MEMDQIKKFMEVNQQRILEDIKLLVESDSPSINKELTDICKANIQLLFQRYFGYKATVIKEKKYGDHLRFEFGEGEETLLLLSHFDTVWDKGDLRYKVKGDKVYGPGILDMKAGLVQAIWALKACKDLGLSLNKKIVFLCTSDEELGSPTSKPIIEKEALNSKVVLVTEPPVAETGALKTARKGSSRYIIDIKGKAAHAGNHHRDGRSAKRSCTSNHSFRRINKLCFGNHSKCRNC